MQQDVVRGEAVGKGYDEEAHEKRAEEAFGEGQEARVGCGAPAGGRSGGTATAVQYSKKHAVQELVSAVVRCAIDSHTHPYCLRQSRARRMPQLATAAAVVARGVGGRSMAVSSFNCSTLTGLAMCTSKPAS